jgi:hypothetical protein
VCAGISLRIELEFDYFPVAGPVCDLPPVLLRSDTGDFPLSGDSVGMFSGTTGFCGAFSEQPTQAIRHSASEKHARKRTQTAVEVA